VKVFFEGPNGLEAVEVDFTKLSEEELEVYAIMGIADARKELKNRIGFDQFKAPEELTPDDARFYAKWQENQMANNQDKMIDVSNDEGLDQ
jgi:hypothetical protein